MDIKKSDSQIVFNQERKDWLRSRIINSITELGFSISGDGDLFLPNDKEFIRKANKRAVQRVIKQKRDLIKRRDIEFTEHYIANGSELNVKGIMPMLVPVDNRNNDLFNWTKLHWSIPISAGYGRRLRYLVMDENNGALIGIIGLADPVYGLKDRDNLIGWKPEVRKKRLKHIMDSFVLGAVPPYSMLLGGKLVASMLASPTIRHDFMKKYGGTKSLISREVFNGKLAAITTASAFGKSSIYDRIHIKRGPEFLHAGWSQGSGEFHLFSDIYPELVELVRDRVLSKKNPRWGKGIRNRRVVLREALDALELPHSLLYHNVRRELFIVPLGRNAFGYLQGKYKGVGYYQISHDEIYRKILKRWVFKRAEWDKRYISFDRYDYSLSKE